MQAFHNDLKVQNLYLDRIRAHAKADEITKGFYWEKGKGCAVGCTVHSSSHKAYETELGIPQWLARLEDRIFEGLSNERAKKFPVQFLEAVNLGADLEKIKTPMLIFIVESARQKRKKTKNERSLKAIDGVLAELRKDVLDLPKLHEALDALVAYAAADVADVAAYAAAYAAYGVDANVAFAAAARRNEYAKLADKLLELIRECK